MWERANILKIFKKEKKKKNQLHKFGHDSHYQWLPNKRRSTEKHFHVELKVLLIVIKCSYVRKMWNESLCRKQNKPQVNIPKINLHQKGDAIYKGKSIKSKTTLLAKFWSEIFTL